MSFTRFIVAKVSSKFLTKNFNTGWALIFLRLQPLLKCFPGIHFIEKKKLIRFSFLVEETKLANNMNGLLQDIFLISWSIRKKNK